MLDRPTQQDAKVQSRRVCIIGAGISGLVSAKVMRERGYEVVVVEKSGDLGGVWEPARSYPGVRTQTPRDLYAFTDFPMPASYPEWPSGPQVYAYLNAYAERSGLRPFIRFGVEVLSLSRATAEEGWVLRLSDGHGAPTTEVFGIVIVATGQFSSPKTLDVAGAEAFAAGGGRVVHSSRHGAGSAVTDRDVVVVGFSKSATDVAMHALSEGARSVTLVFRETAWKIPYFFGGVVNFKNILYSRASEAMFMPWAPSPLGRLLRRMSAPLIWANWRALEALLNRQFGLTKLGLRPRARIEDSIHCATSIETPGFYDAIRAGRIKTIKAGVAGYEAGHVTLDDGGRVKADLAVLAIGWVQDLPFLDPAIKRVLIEPDGQYRLYRMMVNPDLPGLGFVGFNSSFITTLSAELGAHWFARYLAGELRPQPDSAAMRSEIAATLRWKREERISASTFGGLCIAPYHHFHFDQLMRDMGARTKGANPLRAHLAPINPAAYGRLLATAPRTLAKSPAPAG